MPVLVPPIDCWTAATSGSPAAALDGGMTTASEGFGGVRSRFGAAATAGVRGGDALHRRGAGVVGAGEGVRAGDAATATAAAGPPREVGASRMTSVR